MIRAEHSIFTSYLLNNVISTVHTSVFQAASQMVLWIHQEDWRTWSQGAHFTFFFLFEIYILVKHVLSCIMEKQSDFGVLYLV